MTNGEESQLARKSLVAAIVSGTGAVLVLASLAYAGIRLSSARKELNDLEDRKSSLQTSVTELELKLDNLRGMYESTVKELDEGFSNAATPAPQIGAINREEILRSVQGRRRRALELAFELLDKKTPFRWGGKKPADGLDTSGFVAYILSQVGVLDRPERYWSGLLRQTFENKALAPSDLQPGDLIFEENKACWFVLTARSAIGMVPGGIMIGEPRFFSSKIIGYGKVHYEQPGR